MKNFLLITLSVCFFILGLGSLISFIKDFSLVSESYAIMILAFFLSATLLSASVHLGYLYFRRMRRP